MRRLLALFALLGVRAAAQFSGPLPRDPHILTYPLLTMRAQPVAGVPLLFSDSPEVPDRSGVLYRDSVQGPARVLAYHLNGLNRAARLLVVARNPGPAPVRVTVLRRGAAVTPGPDPLVGQQTLLRYLAARPLAARSLPPGAELRLSDSGPLAPGALASVLLDLSASGPLEVSVLLLGPDVARGTPTGSLPVLPLDGTHQRGTFPGADRVLEVRVTQRPARLVFGGADDPPLTGVDALTGTPQRLAGNYGVRYALSLRGSAGSTLAASARGGAYRGALALQDAGRARTLLIGTGAGLTDPAQPARLWRARGDLELLFIPAGGSNLPLALVVY